MQRLLEHKDSQDPEHQQMDDSSSGSSDNRELSDGALTDGPSGRGCSCGPRGRGRSQGPSGLGRLVGSGIRPHSEECGDHSSSVLSSDRDRSGGPRDSEGHPFWASKQPSNLLPPMEHQVYPRACHPHTVRA